MKEKLLILFPEGNLPYSPTTLNLIRFLSNDFEIYVLENRSSVDCSIEDLKFTSISLNLKKNVLRYHRGLELLRRSVFRNINGNESSVEESYMYKAYYHKIKAVIAKVKPARILAVDLFALHCCQKLNLDCIFLSLEIPANKRYFKSLSHKGIKAVLIQSVERYHHLFAEVKDKPRYFILPNAPIFERPNKRTVASKRLVYNGALWSGFGTQFCLSLITKYPEYELHLKGQTVSEKLVEVYFPFLLNSGSLFLDQEYLQQEELNEYLRNFSIGFCFYHFEHPFIKENDFNYRTGPSGKLYTYLSNGLPVVCSNIQAFKFVAEAGAGILIDNYSPDCMKEAIDKILSDYSFYSDNALKLGEQSSFKKNIAPVIAYILKYTDKETETSNMPL